MPDSEQLVDQDGLYREPFLVLDPGMHTAGVRQLDVDKEGRFVVTGSEDKTVRVWSAEDGRLLSTIRMPAGPGDTGKVYAVAISPDGSTIAAGGWTGITGGKNIYLFERTTGREVGRIGSLPSILHLAFSADGEKFAAALSGKAGVRLFEARSLKQIASDAHYGDRSGNLAFDQGGRIVSTSWDGKIRLYGPALDRLLTAVDAPDGKRPFGIAFSPDGSRIAVGYDDTPSVSVLDGRTLQPARAADTHDVDDGNLGIPAWSADGRLLYAGGSWPEGGRSSVRVWGDNGYGPARDYPLTSDTITDLRPVADGRLAVASIDPLVLMLGPTGSTIWQAEPRTACFREQHNTLKVSADGTRVSFGYEASGLSPARFSLRLRLLDTDPAPDSDLAPARTRGLVVEGWNGTYEPKIAGRQLELDRYEKSCSVAIAPDGASLVLGSEWWLRRFDHAGELNWRVAVPGVAWAVNVTEDGRIVVAAFADGTIRWYRMQDGAELLAFYPHTDRKRWVAWTPLGHYVSSPGAEDLIQWQINRGLDKEPEVYTASRFRDRFYRPDVVERVLDELDPLKALEAADREVGRTTNLKSIATDTPPRVAIIDPADNTFIDEPELSLAYTIEDHPGTVIRRVRLLLDGRVAAEERSLAIPTDGRLSRELRVTLQGGSPVLTLLAESERGSSDPSSIRVRHRAERDSHKPVLYVLAVGVSTFKNHPNLNLRCADKDAADFIDRLRLQEGGLYRRAEIRPPLLNGEATATAILEGLEWLERQMSSRDVAVVFFSTHGANDARGDFYLLPHDADVSDEIRLRRTAVDYNELRRTLIRLADRGKTLVFLDACHSGNVVPGTKAAEPADIDQVAADLASAENGVIVFSSSTGKQFSIELPELGHGAFTAAILEAFDGKSDLLPPWLRVADLGTWLAERVKKLTKGIQTPMITVPTERFTNPVVFRMRVPAG